MKTFSRFLVLVVILNVVRYIVGSPIEALVITDGMHSIMAEHPECFNTEFNDMDFAISLFYNFVLWLSAAGVFYMAHKTLRGSYLVRNFKVFGMMCLFFLSLTAAHMNHFAGPVKVFHLFSMLDAILLFPIVAFANWLLFPRLFKKEMRA